MDDGTDALLQYSTSAQIGYWFAGFILPMAIAFILLRIASAKWCNNIVSIILRVFAVILTLFLLYAGYLGGGAVNPGAILAVVVTVIWVIKQFTAKPAHVAESTNG